MGKKTKCYASYWSINILFAVNIVVFYATLALLYILLVQFVDVTEGYRLHFHNNLLQWKYINIIHNISLKGVPEGDPKSEFIQVMAWYSTGDKLLPELILTQLTSAYMDGLVQERRNSIADALELRISCTNPLNYEDFINRSKYLRHG